MDELVIPNPSQHDVATFTILIDDNVIDPLHEVISISVMQEVNRIPAARIILRDGDAAERNFRISNEDNFIPGKRVRIKIGMDGDNTQVFKGIIVKHAIKVQENGNTQLHIECRDESVRMSIGRRSRYFENVKDSQVFDELAGAYGLRSDSESTPLTHKELVQHHITDWDFVLLRAEANGMLVNVQQGVLKISKPKTTAEPVLQLTYGSSVIEFEAEMDARDQFKKVKAISWDYSGQKLFEADTEEFPSFQQHGNLAGAKLADAIGLSEYEMHHSGHLLEQELQEWVNGLMLRSRMAKIRGRARVTGFSGVNPGDMVMLDGVGERFNGKAYVTAVRHDVTDGAWYTHIQFGLDPERYANLHADMVDPQSAGLIGSVHGLQIGIVVQLQDDPDGDDRILVRVPVIDNNAQGTWMRVASLDAGSDRGAFFMPEIGDEVIVGFINDDPRHGVVLGMVNSSAKPAPLRLEDVNHKKGFTTRSKMRIHFNDDTKTITIDTPAGNSVTLDEQGSRIEVKDQNDNRITLDTAGIKLESPMSIEIKAGLDLKLAAAASLTIGGTSLSVKADGNLGIQGAATKLSAQGITEISGSLVKIN